MDEDNKGQITGREGLSPKEEAVMSLFAEGLSIKQVAERLRLSIGTVNTYSMRLYQKLGVHTRSQAVALYVRGAPGTSSSGRRT